MANNHPKQRSQSRTWNLGKQTWESSTSIDVSTSWTIVFPVSCTRHRRVTLSESRSKIVHTKFFNLAQMIWSEWILAPPLETDLLVSSSTRNLSGGWSKEVASKIAGILLKSQKLYIQQIRTIPLSSNMRKVSALEDGKSKNSIPIWVFFYESCHGGGGGCFKLDSGVLPHSPFLLQPGKNYSVFSFLI